MKVDKMLASVEDDPKVKQEQQEMDTSKQTQASSSEESDGEQDDSEVGEVHPLHI
jgi:hypothetical protein